jgi:hypothetical protein
MAAYEAIATNEVGGAGSYTPTLTWSSIPQTYEHLILRGSLRKGGVATYSGIDSAIKMEFNNNTASTWAEAYHGPTSGAGARAANTLGYVRNISSNSTRYPHFMYVEIIIGGYSRTDNPKSALYRTWGGGKSSQTNSGLHMIIGCLCEDPDGGTLAAISEIDLTCVGASSENLAYGAGSIMTLYGLKSS